MVVWSAIGFTVFFLGLVGYVVIDAIRMKPKEIPVVVGSNKEEIEASFKSLTDMTDKIKNDLNKISEELKKRDIKDDVLTEPIKEISKSLGLYKRREMRSYLESLYIKTSQSSSYLRAYYPGKEGEGVVKLVGGIMGRVIRQEEFKSKRLKEDKE